MRVGNFFRSSSSASKLLFEQNSSIKSEAFAFLPRCLKSKFDMTSAEPPYPNSTGIMPPPKVLKITGEGENFSDWTEFHGTSRGEEVVLQECVKFFNRRGIECSQSNVSLSNNILSAIESIYGKIGLNESRKILVPTPTFGYYFQQFKDKGISFNTMPTTSAEGFLPNPQMLEDAIVRNGSVALLLCYPNNPTGTIMTEECAHAIADITGRHNVFVISDEAFMNNSLSQKQHFPIAAIKGMVDRSLTITSAAKSTFIGRKIGFCVGNPDIIDGFERIGGYPTKRDQRVMMAAIEDSAENREYLKICRDHYLRNIDLIKGKSEELNQKFCQQFGEEKVYVRPFIKDPDAANVYLMDFSGLRGKQRSSKIMNTGLDVAKWLLEDASIGTVPGECFLFDEKEMLVRITLNHGAREIEMAFDSAISAVKSIDNSPSITPIQKDKLKFSPNTLDIGGKGEAK